MKIINVGYDHRHDADFFIDRPEGSGDYLLLLLKTQAVFTIDGKDIIASEGTAFLYPKGKPQFYRCVKGCFFENDWIHFDFDSDEEKYEFLGYHIPFETPITLDIRFLSYCIKSVSYEHYANNPCSRETIECFMKLIFIKLHEQILDKHEAPSDFRFDMISTIRSKIYSKPYEQRTVDIAAHEISMSRSAFQKAYKKQFGVTFVEDLNNSRIAYSEMLLTTTSLTIEDIALMSGYKTYVHFIRRFKYKNKITPSEYRKLNQNVT